MVEADAKPASLLQGIFRPSCPSILFLGDGGIVNPVPVDVAKPWELICHRRWKSQTSLTATKLEQEATKIRDHWRCGAERNRNNPQEKGSQGRVSPNGKA